MKRLLLALGLGLYVTFSSIHAQSPGWNNGGNNKEKNRPAGVVTNNSNGSRPNSQPLKSPSQSRPSQSSVPATRHPSQGNGTHKPINTSKPTKPNGGSIGSTGTPARPNTNNGGAKPTKPNGNSGSTTSGKKPPKPNGNYGPGTNGNRPPRPNLNLTLGINIIKPPAIPIPFPVGGNSNLVSTGGGEEINNGLTTTGGASNGEEGNGNEGNGSQGNGSEGNGANGETTGTGNQTGGESAGNNEQNSTEQSDRSSLTYEWKHEHGKFTLTEGGEWEERVNTEEGTMLFTYRQYDSTKDYIELHDARRDCRVRIYNSEVFLKYPRQGYPEFTRCYEGSWKGNRKPVPIMTQEPEADVKPKP